MALKIGNLGIFVALFTFIGSIIRIYLEFTEIIPCGCQNVFHCVPVLDCKPLTFEFSTKNRLWTSLLDTFIVLIALIVAAIPEGLPLAVSISLSFSCKQMLRY
jgi:magnesium-transporting ATPase (P-type)